MRRGASAAGALVLLILQLALAAVAPASAATPLNIFVGYMDTHSVASSSKQPTPWPYTDPTSYVGSPCAAYPNSTTCWDAAALRLDNPGSVDVTGIHPVVTIGSSTYNLWGTNLTVKAHGTLVLTETGGQNSTNFDGSDFAPNSYNGGNTASCVNSGAIPNVQITIGGSTTSYLDSSQVLNGGGVDSGHCVNGSFVSGRIDESHPWLQIGTAAPTVPTAPQSLAAVPGDGSVSLSWSAPTSDGGSAITGYNVYRGTSAGGESSTPIASNVSSTSFTDTTITNGTPYFYKVAAVNAVGASAQSNEASATPQVAQPTAPSAPTGLTAAGGNGSVALSWTAPTSNGGSPITGYSIYRGSTAGGESPTPIATNVTGTSFTDTGEVNGTPYFYKVAAVNAVGTSTQSNEASATPQPTLPSAPLGLVASAGDGSVALSWQMPTSDGGSGITGYNVYRGTSAGGESSVPLASNVALTSFTDTTAVNGTGYFYKVAAVNAVGTSAMSNEASATPQAAVTVASAPQSLAAVGGNATVALSWVTPASNGGSAITGYNVYRGTTAGGEALVPLASNVSGTTFTDTSVTNGTGYFYKVAAVNAVGTSAMSNEASATPQATAPGAPTGLAAVAGIGSVSLTWSAPASNGGSAVTGYNVYRGTTAGGEALVPLASNVSGTSFMDTTVVSGTRYFYKVAAVNGIGTSVLSNEASATPPTVPGAPTGLAAVGGNATVALSWTAPSSNGGSGVTGYNVYRGTTAGGEALVPLASNVSGTTFTDTTVTNGTGYFYKVAAVNAVGASVLSNEASATPQAAAPGGYVGRVGSATASTSRTTTTVTVGSAGVQGGHGLVVSLLLSSTSLTAAVSAKDTAGNTYAVARDVNDGSASDRVVTLVAFGVKALPAGATITLTYPSAAETHVSVDELSGVTGLDTSAGASGTAAAFSSGSATTTQAGDFLFGDVGVESASGSPAWASGWTGLPNLSVSTDYLLTAYRAATTTGAYTANGTSGGQWMATLLAFKAGSPPPPPPPTVPGAPTGLGGVAGSGQVALSWTAPASNGGSAVTGYNVYRGTSAGAEGSTPIASNVAGTSFTDTTVTNGTGYFYKVAAVNAVGASGLSNEASATPQAAPTVPGAPTGLAAVGGNATVALSWTAPASNGGSAVTGYNVYRGTSAGAEGSTPIASNVAGTSFTDTTVVNGTGYFYKVAAVNAVGASVLSNEASATPQAAPTVPGAPTGLGAVGGNATVALSWTAPASNGGSAVTGYNVYRGTSAGAEGTTPIASNVAGTSFTDTTVVNGTGYFYKVAAVNAVGASVLSNEASATPQAAPTVPGAPTGLGAVGGNATVALSWTAPASNGGSAITGYNVYRGTSAGAEGTTPIASNVSGTSFTDTTVTNGTGYFYKVAAVNAVGASGLSNEASATPQAAPTVPGAPTGLGGVAGSGQVALSWTAPASNGGSAVTGYNVYRGTSAGAEGTTPIASNVAGTSFTDTTVVNGTGYFYKVAAVNAVGASVLSNEASATPQAAAPGGYVGRVGSATASTSRTTTTVTVGAAGVQGGHGLVVSLLLSSTSLTAAVSAKDTAGNTYAVARDVNDGSASDRVVTLVAFGVKALPAGATITLTYPSAAETHVSVDELSGVTGLDTSAGASGTAAAFSSGSATTTQAGDFLFGDVGVESASGSPAWASGWTGLPNLSVSTDYLLTAYRAATTTGAYTANGTSGGQWMATILAFKTG